MKRLWCGALLLIAGSVLAQQQGRLPYQPPPYSTPLPPDTKAPPAVGLSNTEAQQQINKKLSTEPLLTALEVKATVNDSTVILTGTVEDERQHDLAWRIAESYAGERRIVDNIRIQQTP